MKVICAWCENEGKETLIREVGLFDIEVTSHGICIDHEKGLLKQIKELRMKQNPQLRRSAQPRSSSSPAVPNCTIPWRRRHTGRMPDAQLSLAFMNDEFRVDFVEQELGLAPA